MTHYIYGLNYISTGQLGSWSLSGRRYAPICPLWKHAVPLLSFSAFILSYLLTFFWLLSLFQSDRSCSCPGLWEPKAFIFSTASIWPLWFCHCWPLLLPCLSSFFSYVSGLSSGFLCWLLFLLRSHKCWLVFSHPCSLCSWLLGV